MANFTDDEIESVVDQLVMTSIRRPYDTLGVRRNDITWTDIQESAAGVLLMYPSSPFYVAYLSSQNLLGNLVALESVGAQLLQALQVLRRRVLPVEDLSSLNNAKVALFELETVVGDVNAPKDVTKVPAYVRFNSNVDRFLSRVGGNVRSNGEVVPTPDQARQDIPSYVESFLSTAQSLLTQVQNVIGAIEDYTDVNLPRIVSKTVVSNARVLLDDRTTELEGLDQTGRLAVLRQTVLELLAMKGVVKKFGSFSGPADGQNLVGTAIAFADADRPANPAEIVFDIPGPYPLVADSLEESSTNIIHAIVDTDTPILSSTVAATSANLGNSVTFTRVAGSFLDDNVVAGSVVYVEGGSDLGAVRRVTNVTASVLTCSGPALTGGACTITVFAPTVSIYLPPSIPAKIDGLTAGTFNISAGYNDSLVFSIDGGADIPVPLTPGIGRTAAQVAADITAGLAATDFHGETYYSPLLFDGGVNIAGNDITLPYGNFPSLFEVGNTVEIYFGENAGEIRTITALLPSASAYNTIQVDGPALVSSTRDRIKIGSSDSVKVRIAPKDFNSTLNVLANRTTLQVKMPTSVEQQAGITLGIYGELLVKSSLTDTATLVDFVNQNTDKLTASSSYDPTVNGLDTTGIALRTDAALTTTMVAYKAYGTGSWGAGLNVTVAIGQVELAFGEVLVGDFVVLRGGNDVDAVGVITSATDTEIEATFTSALTASTNALFEVIPAELAPDPSYQGLTVTIDSGPNAGTNYIEEVHSTIPGQYKLRRQPTTYKDGFNQPVRMTGSFGYEYLVLKSTSTLTDSRIFCFDPVAYFFFAFTGQGNQVGTTPYVQLPLPVPKEVQEGDFFEEYITSAGTPDRTLLIDTLFSDGVVSLDDVVAVNQSYAMNSSSVQPPPSAVVRPAQFYSFDAYKNLLQAWIDASPFANLRAYELELNRVVNPLLQNLNPTDADCGAAENQVKLLYRYTTEDAALATSFSGTPLETVVGTYEVPKINEVDALIKSFKEKGADRAVDLLVDCQFQTFFGLDVDEASYGGYMQKSVREVASNDLPIRKFRRLAATTSPLRSSAETPDFEFASDDVDENPAIDPPVTNSES